MCVSSNSSLGNTSLLPEETVLVMLTISVEISSPALEASATAVWATSTASDDFGREQHLTVQKQQMIVQQPTRFVWQLQILNFN